MYQPAQAPDDSEGTKERGSKRLGPLAMISTTANYISGLLRVVHCLEIVGFYGIEYSMQVQQNLWR